MPTDNIKNITGNKNKMEPNGFEIVPYYMETNNREEKIMDKKTKKLIGQIFFFGLERFKGFKHDSTEERKKFTLELIEARKAFVEAENNF